MDRTTRDDARFQALIERSTDVITVLSPEGTFQYVSPSIEHVLGHDPESLPDDFALTYVHEADRERVRTAFDRVVENPDADPLVQCRFRRGDGSYALVESTVRNLLDDPAVGGIVVNTRDVTGRTARQRALEQYETILETIPGGVFILDEAGTILDANEAALELFDIDREAVVGELATVLVELDRIDQRVIEEYLSVADALLRTDDGEQTGRLEATVSRPDGDERTVEVVIRARPGESFTGVIGVLTDVTERERAIERLAAERDRFATLFEEVADSVVEYVYVDDVPIAEAVNPAFEETFGYEASTIVGSNVNEYIVPESDHEHARSIDERSRTGERVVSEVRRETSSGVRDFIVHNAAIEAGDAVRGYAIYTDITEQRTRERTVERLHGATRQLLEATSRAEVATVTTDAIADILGYPVNAVRFLHPDGETLAVSGLTNGAVGELGSRPTYSLTADFESPPVHAYLTGEAVVYEDVSVVDDGYDREPLRSAAYLPIGRYGTLSLAHRDPGVIDEADVRLAEILTANVEATLRRLDREAELRHREAELARENERLEEFAGIVSHDLRNPLAVARGHLDIARDSDDPVDSLDTVESALDRMDELIGDVLTLAREGEAVGETEPVELATVVEEAWAMTSTSENTLEYGSLGTVEADHGRLRSLFENLFSNVVDHVGPGAHVRIEALPEGFAVEDDGPGVPESVRAEVFDPGYSTAETGTGLGLNIVRTIAGAHGWTVRLTEGRDGGARFEFSGLSREPASGV